MEEREGTESRERTVGTLEVLGLTETYKTQKERFRLTRTVDSDRGWGRRGRDSRDCTPRGRVGVGVTGTDLGGH